MTEELSADIGTIWCISFGKICFSIGIFCCSTTAYVKGLGCREKMGLRDSSCLFLRDDAGGISNHFQQIIHILWKQYEVSSKTIENSKILDIFICKAIRQNTKLWTMITPLLTYHCMCESVQMQHFENTAVKTISSFVIPYLQDI